MADLFDAGPLTPEEEEMERQLAEMDARRAQKRARAAAERGETCENCKHGTERLAMPSGYATGFYICAFGRAFVWLGATSICQLKPVRFQRRAATVVREELADKG